MAGAARPEGLVRSWIRNIGGLRGVWLGVAGFLVLQPPRPCIAVVVKCYGAARSMPILLLLEAVCRENNVLLVMDAAGPPPRVGNGRITTVELPGGRVAKLLSILWIRLVVRPRCAVAFDPHAFHLAVRFCPLSRIVYYSLELYLSYNCYELSYPPKLARFERRHLPRAAALVIQSEERLRLLLEDYRMVAPKRSLLSPVCASPVGRASGARRLRRTGHVAMLHLGGLSAALGVERFCDVVQCVPAWSFLIHGHAFGESRERLLEKARTAPHRNIELSEQYFDSPTEAEGMCELVDVGLAWYGENLTPNFDTAVRASGKIASYLKHGLPVIVRRHGSFLGLEAAGCAIALDRPEDLPEATRTIIENYEAMSAAALRAFETTYDSSLYDDELADLISQVVK